MERTDNQLLNTILSPQTGAEGDKPLLVVVTGPTASGKTALAIEIARRLGTEIVSADSRQIYRGIPITTAVPTAAERAAVPHHLVECKDITESYSAASFAEDAMAILDDLFRRYGCAVVCGGSMMYIDALTKGIDDIPDISDAVRMRVQQIYADSGMEAVLAMLQIYDPEYYNTVDRANTRRVMHALEVCLQSGCTYTSLRTGAVAERPFRTQIVAIDRSRDELFARINARVDAMVEAGMEAEARSMYPYRHLNALNTVGFKEWFAHFDGTMDRATTIARIAKNTRVYAKKQLLWLSKQPSVTMVSPDALV